MNHRSPSNHDNLRNPFVNSAPILAAFCTLIAFGGRAAQAQATAVTTPGQLGNTVRTSQYPNNGPLDSAGDGTIIPSTFSVPAGSNNVSFTATTSPGPTEGFISFVTDISVAPQFTIGDILEETSANSTGAPTGPLRINFQTGVTGFGLFAQDFIPDTETFTLTVFNGVTPLSVTPFTYAPTDNTSSAGAAVFVGALSNGGPLITSALLSSISSSPNASNDFYFGPTQVQAPVPEASTVVSFGMGVLLFAGFALGARRRKAGGRTQSATQSAMQPATQTVA